MKKYLFRKYDSSLSSFFAREKRRIVHAIGSAGKVEHVGSTAVPGLGGKGILDICVGVPKGKISSTKRKLERGGYTYRQKASVPGRIFFRCDCIFAKKKKRVHLHLVVINRKDWNEMIFFRDYLRTNPMAQKKYIDIKRRAVKIACGDGAVYMEQKEAFIVSISKKSRNKKKPRKIG